MPRPKPIYEGTYLRHVFALANRQFCLPPLVFLAAYWLTPAVILAGTQISNDFGTLKENFVHLYASDYTHLSFSAVSACIVFFCYRFVRLLHLRAGDMLQNSKGNSTPPPLSGDYQSVVNMARSKITIMFSIMLAMLCFVTLLQKVTGEEYAYWWGNYSHGFAGYVYAAIASVFVFTCTQYLILLLLLSVFFRRFVGEHMRLRPFHRDGVSGLGKFGTMISSIWAQSILFSGALLIVFQSGYLGLVDDYFVWVLGGFIIFVLPIAAIYPIIATTLAASRLKKMMIARAISEHFKQNTSCDLASKDDLTTFLSLRRELSEIRVFPFKSTRFVAIAGFNILQAYVAASTILIGP